jgi:hypothetical protein
MFGDMICQKAVSQLPSIFVYLEKSGFELTFHRGMLQLGL